MKKNFQLVLLYIKEVILLHLSHFIYSTFIRLGLTFSRVMFENTEMRIKTNIKKYIRDIMFEDENGCQLLFMGNTIVM